jgi:hypothetical protein
MARKPNYNFERRERERIKAETAEERAKLKAEKKAATKAGEADPESAGAMPAEQSNAPSDE